MTLMLGEHIAKNPAYGLSVLEDSEAWPVLGRTWAKLHKAEKWTSFVMEDIVGVSWAETEDLHAYHRGSFILALVNREVLASADARAAQESDAQRALDSSRATADQLHIDLDSTAANGLSAEDDKMSRVQQTAPVNQPPDPSGGHSTAREAAMPSMQGSNWTAAPVGHIDKMQRNVDQLDLDTAAQEVKRADTKQQQQRAPDSAAPAHGCSSVADDDDVQSQATTLGARMSDSESSSGPAPVRPVHVDVTQQNDEDRVGLDSAKASSSGLSADLGGGGLSREQPCSGSGTPTKIHPDPAAASATTPPPLSRTPTQETASRRRSPRAAGLNRQRQQRQETAQPAWTEAQRRPSGVSGTAHRSPPRPPPNHWWGPQPRPSPPPPHHWWGPPPPRSPPPPSQDPRFNPQAKPMPFGLGPMPGPFNPWGSFQMPLPPQCWPEAFFRMTNYLASYKMFGELYAYTTAATLALDMAKYQFVPFMRV
jgi:hypothetical protein